MPFSDLEIALAFVALLACLVAGGAWLSRGKHGEEPNDDPHSLEEKAASQATEAADLLTKCMSLEAERSEAQAQLEQLQAECTDAREEAELTLLQLHQVQEELEHYFLLSQDLQQKLDQAQGSLATASEAVGWTPSDRAALAHHTSEQAQALSETARRLHVSEADLPSAAVRDLVARQSVDFQAAADRVLNKNQELYRQLA